MDINRKIGLDLPINFINVKDEIYMLLTNLIK